VSRYPNIVKVNHNLLLAMGSNHYHKYTVLEGCYFRFDDKNWSDGADARTGIGAARIVMET